MRRCHDTILHHESGRGRPRGGRAPDRRWRRRTDRWRARRRLRGSRLPRGWPPSPPRRRLCLDAVVSRTTTPAMVTTEASTKAPASRLRSMSMPRTSFDGRLGALDEDPRVEVAFHKRSANRDLRALAVRRIGLNADPTPEPLVRCLGEGVTEPCGAVPRTNKPSIVMSALRSILRALGCSPRGYRAG